MKGTTRNAKSVVWVSAVGGCWAHGRACSLSLLHGSVLLLRLGVSACEHTRVTVCTARLRPAATDTAPLTPAHVARRHRTPLTATPAGQSRTRTGATGPRCADPDERPRGKSKCSRERSVTKKSSDSSCKNVWISLA